jgi:3-methyladenine DNA glycosylase AlkD
VLVQKLKTDIVTAIRKELVQNVDEKTRDGAQRFFKEDVKFYGVKSAVVRNIAKKYFRNIKSSKKQEIFSLCEKLLESDYGEEAFIAFEWAYLLRREYEPVDFQVFERWIKEYVNNWAKCDTLCNHAVGSFVEVYPEYIKNLKDWARSENRWLRRASAVTLILPARKGKFLKDVFEISDILLEDKDDMVQKGYGWMLKEASKSHQEEVFGYIMKRKGEMPRTALRYAIEKMPVELRRKAMER